MIETSQPRLLADKQRRWRIRRKRAFADAFRAGQKDSWWEAFAATFDF
jgi:hypothetical protein